MFLDVVYTISLCLYCRRQHLEKVDKFSAHGTPVFRTCTYNETAAGLLSLQQFNRGPTMPPVDTFVVRTRHLQVVYTPRIFLRTRFGVFITDRHVCLN